MIYTIRRTLAPRDEDHPVSLDADTDNASTLFLDKTKAEAQYAIGLSEGQQLPWLVAIAKGHGKRTSLGGYRTKASMQTLSSELVARLTIAVQSSLAIGDTSDRDSLSQAIYGQLLMRVTWRGQNKFQEASRDLDITYLDLPWQHTRRTVGLDLWAEEKPDAGL